MNELTITEIAERLSVHRTTVWTWYKDGRIKSHRRKGPGKTSDLLFREQDIQKFCQQSGMLWPEETSETG